MFSSNTEFLLVLLGLLAVSLLVSLALTRLLLVLLPRWGMVDRPDFKRHIHTVPVPRGGGIGFAAALLGVTACFLLLFPPAKETVRETVHILLPAGILLPLGILDDRRGLRAGVKFLFQILAALLAWHLGIRMTSFFGLRLAPWSSCLLTVFWTVALINAFNMIDGIDGLAGGIGCISALCMAFIALTQGYRGMVCLQTVFIGSLLGFLVFNWHPAKVFMGDTGSMFIGYLLAVSGIGLNARLLSVASVGVPLLACGVPVLDICLAVWRRLFSPDALSVLENGNGGDNGAQPAGTAAATPRKGFARHLVSLLKRLGTADRKHLHHRFLEYFHNNQSKTVCRIYVLAGAMGAVAVLCALIPGQSRLLALTLIIGTFSAVVSRLATLELWSSAETLFHNFHSARTGALLSHAVHPVYDLTVIALASWVTSRGGGFGDLQFLAEHVTIVMAVLIFSRNYRVFWNYSVSDDYFRLLLTLCAGYYLSWLVCFCIHGRTPCERFVACGGAVFALVVGERLFLHYCRNYIIARRNSSRLAQRRTAVSTVLFGITPLARLYRDRLAASFRESEDERILGLVTGDRRYVHSYCYGMKVLATTGSLEELFARHPFHRLVLTAEPSPGEYDQLRSFADAHNIRMVRLSLKEE